MTANDNRAFDAPLFSVIVPVYNAAATLAATVQSVLAQSCGDFEMILIDDGSRDDSLNIMLDLAAHDTRIKALSQPNQGVSATRNLGVELARGRLIAFLDADDLWHPEKLAAHRWFHQFDGDIGASYARIAFIDGAAQDHQKARTTSSIIPGQLTVAQLLAENPVCTMSNLVVTRACMAAVGPFEAGMSFAEDQEWLARAAHLGWPIEGIDAVLVDYRLSADGLSVNLEAMYDGWRHLAARYQHGEALDAAEAVYCRYLARRALRSGAQPGQALHYVQRGLKLDARAFLDDARRGWMTLISALAAPIMPRALRLHMFS